MFTPSVQQQEFFDWILHSDGSALLQALAGSGKTTTLLESLNFLEGNLFFGAYNKKIAEELQNRAPKNVPVKISTMHAAGFGYLKQIAPAAKLDNYKCSGIYRAIAGYDKQLKALEGAVLSLVSYAKQAGVGINCAVDDVDAWKELIDHFNVDTNEEEGVVIHNAIRTLKKSITDCKTTIDFEDMIYYPLLMNAVKGKYDWVLADEVQDFNETRRLLAMRMLRSGGRLVGVGDKNQSIYGFSGADYNSMDILQSYMAAVELPLSVSYRCPKSVVLEAQQYVPEIQFHEDAPDGIVRHLPGVGAMMSEVKKGDVILCRYNAPIVELVYKFILLGIPAKIEGRDIGAGLKSLAKKWKSKDFSTYISNIENYEYKHVEQYKELGKHYLADALQDRVRCLMTIIQRVTTKYTTGLPCDLVCAEIDKIFGDVAGSNDYVLLSSIHRAKGLEWNRVYWLTTKPSTRKMLDWEVQVENNLRYVAITRSKNELVYVPLKQTGTKFSLDN